MLVGSEKVLGKSFTEHTAGIHALKTPLVGAILNMCENILVFCRFSTQKRRTFMIVRTCRESSIASMHWGLFYLDVILFSTLLLLLG